MIIFCLRQSQCLHMFWCLRYSCEQCRNCLALSILNQVWAIKLQKTMKLGNGKGFPGGSLMIGKVVDDGGWTRNRQPHSISPPYTVEAVLTELVLQWSCSIENHVTCEGQLPSNFRNLKHAVAEKRRDCSFFLSGWIKRRQLGGEETRLPLTLNNIYSWHLNLFCRFIINESPEDFLC